MALSAVAAVVGKGRASAGIAQFLVKRSDSFMCGAVGGLQQE